MDLFKNDIRPGNTNFREKGPFSSFSCDNEYVPLYIPFLNDGIYNGKIVQYSFPLNSLVNSAKSYNHFFSALYTRRSLLTFSTSAMRFSLLIRKGIIARKMDNGEFKILFAATVKTEKLKSFARGEYVDKSNFRVYMDRDLILSSDYKNIIKKLDVEVIHHIMSVGVEVHIVDNVVKKCFNNNLEKPKFKSLVEYKEYLQSFNNELIDG